MSRKILENCVFVHLIIFLVQIILFLTKFYLLASTNPK